MSDPINCPKCGHHINEHECRGCSHEGPSGDCDCGCLASVYAIARAYGEQRFNEGWKAHELRWAVGHSE